MGCFTFNESELSDLHFGGPFLLPPGVLIFRNHLVVNFSKKYNNAMSSIMLSFNGNAWSIHYRSQNLCTMFLKKQAGVGMIAYWSLLFVRPLSDHK